MEFTSVKSIFRQFLPQTGELQFVEHLLFGPNVPKPLELQTTNDFDVEWYSFLQDNRPSDSKNEKRKVRIGLFQNAIVEKDPSTPIAQQREAILQLGKKAVETAAKCGVQIICFQECWNMPVIFCTQKKLPWIEFAEDAYNGPTTMMLRQLAKMHNMVIVSPILERDSEDDSLWNTAVIISNCGNVLGISRKNHIPISGTFSETYYYNSSGLGHPVFQTEFARIALPICYDRHHPQCFFSYGLNGAEIVFNPSATVKSFSESLWPVEARDAAVQNGFYVGAINRVGTEAFSSTSSSHTFYGSSYVVGPDGSRTPGLSLYKDGLLIADLDLNKCSKQTAEERIGNATNIFKKQYK